MFRKLLLFTLLLAASFNGFSGQNGNHIQISLLTCGPGDEAVWEVFGHTAVRVIDSDAHTDLVYNYGMFDFGPDFELQFMRGKLLYSVGIQEFRGFMMEYVTAKRKVEEQVLLLDSFQKEHINYFLEWNAEPENRYYKYDFFFDNCATRIRDIFPRPEIFGKTFKFGETRPAGQKLTFRDIINSYFYKDHWTRLGVNILLGSRIDKVMSNTDIMFLPDYLRDGVGGSTAKGKKIATPPVVIIPGGSSSTPGPNWPFFVSLGVAILTISGLTVPKLRILGKIMTFLLLFVTGLLGCLLLTMWFATDHQGCTNNFNLLWCLPLNFFLSFLNPKGKGKYALIGIVLLFLSVILHLTKVQGLTFSELSPVFLALLFVYGNIYRNQKVKTTTKNA